MLVEDEAMAAMDLKEDLLRLGYQVPAVVTSGEEAVRVACEIQPDLILMDIMLGGPMSGIDAATAIRKTHAIPVIYLTAHTDDETLAKAKLTEPFGYLPKPCNTATMMSMIEVALYKNQIDTDIRRLERQSFAGELSKGKTKLHEADIALRVLMEQRDRERQEFEGDVRAKVGKLVLPSVRALEKSALTAAQRILVESIKLNLQLLTDAHGGRLGDSAGLLSSTEMQVANFVKAGKSTKEIAQFLNVAASTINTHRDSIRKKMGIKNTKTSLKKVLQSMI
jgi:DNA-binding NarL/FixJ family response regulator